MIAGREVARRQLGQSVIAMTPGSTGTLSSRLPSNSIQLMRAVILSASRRNTGPAGRGEGMDGWEICESPREKGRFGGLDAHLAAGGQTNRPARPMGGSVNQGNSNSTVRTGRTGSDGEIQSEIPAASAA